MEGEIGELLLHIGWAEEVACASKSTDLSFDLVPQGPPEKYIRVVGIFSALEILQERSNMPRDTAR